MKNELKMKKNQKNNKNDNKLLKKQVEKLITEGVQILERIENKKNFNDKVILFNLAKEKFEKGIHLLPNNSDAIYNLSILKLERYEIYKEEDIEISTNEINEVYHLLLKIIQNDTSKRGETTGLSHKTLASLIVQYPVELSQQILNPLEQSKNHLNLARSILATNFELDIYIFEYSQVLFEYWEFYINSLKQKLLLKQQDIEDEYYNSIYSFFIYFKETIESIFSLQSNNGIDKDIYLLYGEFQSSYCEYFITPQISNILLSNSILNSDKFDNLILSLKSNIGTLSFFGNLSFSVLNNLFSLESNFTYSNFNLTYDQNTLQSTHSDILEDIKCSSLCCDLIRNLLELIEKKLSLGNLTNNSLQSLQSELCHFMIQLVQIRVYLYSIHTYFQLSPEIKFETICSLGEDIWFVIEIINRNYSNHLFVDFHPFQQTIQFFIQQFNSILNQENNLLPTNTTINSFQINDQLNIISSIGYQTIFQLFHQSEIYFENSSLFSLINDNSKTCGEEKEETTENEDLKSDYVVLLFNISCILFKLRNIDLTIEYLLKYIHLTLNQNNKEIILNEILNEKDLNGLAELSLFQEKILLLLN